MDKYADILEIVDQMIDLLVKFNKRYWAETFEDAANRIRSPWSTTQAAGIDILKSSFGGMGSINDIYFLADEEPEDGPTASKANTLFQRFTNRLWQSLLKHHD